ncbi:Protein of unknown function [Desulfuromusa kysingii]|uniref:DUF3793 family protein n=2 Tax=Desulfuromusa kysingii TaxID=37625 RepID=A0A1H3VTE6_9BACT|nr:Protein of unknown function [Desulfuromusa kysingii]
MTEAGSSCSASGLKREPTWIDVAGMFPDPKECLTAFLTVAAAEVVAGIKPANLIRIPNQKLPCGRRMYRLWQRFGEELMSILPFTVMTMKVSEESILLLVYRIELLQRRLQGRTMQTFLARLGYPQPLDLDAALAQLQGSFATGIPHEVGMFLGYPFKDVKGFMAQKEPTSQERGMWRIYGPAGRSLQLSNYYRSKRMEMIRKLAHGQVPNQLLQAA